MPLTNLERLRLGVADRARNFSDGAIGDGSTLVFQLSAFPIVSGSTTVYHDGVAVSTGFTIDNTAGRITYTVVPGNGVVITIIGQATVFSDTELNDVLTRKSNDIRASTIEVIEWLMVDASLRFRWATSQGLEVDERTVYEHLSDLYERLLKQQVVDDFTGDAVRWADEQEHYQ